MSENEYVPAPWLLGHGARFRMTSAAAAGRNANGWDFWAVGPVVQ